MTDNKVNMSLDDIIKNERKNKRSTGFASRKRVVRNVKKGRMVGGRINTRPPRNAQRNNVRLNAATVKAVNKLVKRAISQRANQQLIQNAAAFRRTRAPNRIVATRPAGFQSRRAFNRSQIVSTGRLRGVNRRSRVIMSSAARRAQQQEPLVLASNVKTVRGRGAVRLGRLASDEAPVYLERQYVPVVEEEDEEEEEIVERVPRRVPFSRQRQVIVQRRRNVQPVVVQRRVAARPIVVERTTYAPAARRRGIAKQARFATVSNARRFRPVYERIQTVQQPAFKPRRGGRRQFLNPNAVQMREALGIGRPANRQIVQRFEPSSSFLQRVPASSRKGRGFQNRF